MSTAEHFVSLHIAKFCFQYTCVCEYFLSVKPSFYAALNRHSANFLLLLELLLDINTLHPFAFIQSIPLPAALQ
nr:MAG TPA: hypothetical protein [Bacteriophage sp.]